MLSDEEKEAYDNLIMLKYFTQENEDKKAIQIILDLIEKQSKEIEELKDTKKELTERVLRLESDKFWDNVVSKDKIKAKIAEVQNMKAKAKDIVFKSSLNYIETELQSLLEKE